MPKPKPPYPPEFRAEAVRLARTRGKPQAQIARDLGVTVETLRLWRKQADLDEGKRQDGLTSEVQEELSRLRARIASYAKSARFSKKRQPSSPGRHRRSTRPGERLRVCRAREGRSCRRPPLLGFCLAQASWPPFKGPHTFLPRSYLAAAVYTAGRLAVRD